MDFNSLPTEILLIIFDSLDDNDIVNLSYTNKRLNILCDQEAHSRIKKLIGMEPEYDTVNCLWILKICYDRKISRDVIGQYVIINKSLVCYYMLSDTDIVKYDHRDICVRTHQCDNINMFKHIDKPSSNNYYSHCLSCVQYNSYNILNYIMTHRAENMMTTDYTGLLFHCLVHRCDVSIFDIIFRKIKYGDIDGDRLTKDAVLNRNYSIVRYLRMRGYYGLDSNL